MGKLYQSAELMQDAHKRGYGIPAYDTFNFESTKMVFEAAERANTPVIIMMYLGIDMPIDSFAEMVKSLGAKAKVPYALHLDHSPDVYKRQGCKARCPDGTAGAELFFDGGPGGEYHPGGPAAACHPAHPLAPAHAAGAGAGREAVSPQQP